jgi:hypothetical protein
MGGLDLELDLDPGEGTEACASERASERRGNASECGMCACRCGRVPSVSLDSRERRSPLNEWVGLDEYACGV